MAALLDNRLLSRVGCNEIVVAVSEDFHCDNEPEKDESCRTQQLPKPARHGFLSALVLRLAVLCTCTAMDVHDRSTGAFAPVPLQLDARLPGGI
ncbi:Hypothetical protein NGAL_HAMBI2610_17330 [Neorhizobium galegae bv. orientalis]|nr:Hypothetical protein NGAL_HAMBI2610_17330 [Neorhizobium galegae bv. orientalis]